MKNVLTDKQRNFIYCQLSARKTYFIERLKDAEAKEEIIQKYKEAIETLNKAMNCL